METLSLTFGFLKQIEIGKIPILFLVEGNLDEKLDVENGSVLVDQVVLEPGSGVDVYPAAKEAGDRLADQRSLRLLSFGICHFWCLSVKEMSHVITLIRSRDRH